VTVEQQKARREETTSSKQPPKRPVKLDGPPSAQLSIVNAFWQGDHVVLVQRIDDVVAKRSVPAEYTCFIKQADLDAVAERKLRESRHIVSMKREGIWWRVRWHNWKVLRSMYASDGPFARAGIEVYEADVNPVRRFLTDNDVIIQRPKRCFIDLEVDSTKPILKQVEGQSRVLTWSLVDEVGTKVYGCLEADTDEAEELLLGDLWDELLAYDQVCAWGGDRYDFPVLFNRSERLGVTVEKRRWLWLDHLEAYRRFNMSASESGEEKESMALDRVAQAVLGRGKHELDTRNTLKAWQDDPAGLVRYNVRDAELMRDIEAKTGYLELQFTVCETCNTLPDSRGTDPTNFVEGYMLKLGVEHGEHFATSHRWDEGTHEKFEGAYVMAPSRKGILKNVHVCDFAALYPSIIISWNMSPETLTTIDPDAGPLPPGHCVAPYTNKVFHTDRKGLLPIALEKLLTLRGVWKVKKNAEPPGTTAWKDADRRSSAYKIAANSFYGVQGSPFSRFHVRDVAESIAQAGKWLILETHAVAGIRGFEGIYGDTDSLFVTNATREEFAAFVKWCNAELYPKLLEQRGCRENRIKLGYEKEFSRLVIMAKKRYAGRYAHYEGTDATADSKPEIKGLEYKRGDTLKLARDMQYELVQMILYQEVDSVEAYCRWLHKWRERVMKGSMTVADVRLSNALGKDVQLYRRKEKKAGGMSALPVHVEVALKMGEMGLDVGEGVRIEYVVVDGRSPIKAVPLFVV
jgi:DNA polymerase elongation subunit (family B)